MLPAGAPAAGAPDLGAAYAGDAKYTLRTGIAEGRMVFLGVGGEIDGKVNPVLTAAEGQVIQLTLINGEGAEHDIDFPDQDTKSPRVTGKGASTTIAFRAGKSGDFVYFCSVPGHRAAGMEGQFIVTPKPPAQVEVEADISRDPADLPPPIGKRDPQTVRVDLLSGRGGRPSRGRHHVRLLDLQRARAGAVHPGAGRRHDRHSPEELGRQLDDPLGRLPRGDRPRRRRGGAAGRSRRREIDDLEGPDPRASMSIIAPRRWSPSTSPTACMA